MIKQIMGAVCFLLAGGIACFASNPQDLTGLTERVDRLEYQARQGGVKLPPMPIPETAQRIQLAQSAASLAVRVDRLESQMRQYNGQIEELNFRIRQLQEQLRRFQEDSEFRFQDLERGKAKRKSSSSQTQPASPSFEQLGAPPASLGSLTQDQMSNDTFANNGVPPTGGPIDLSSMLAGGQSSVNEGNNNALPVSNLTGDPATDYDMAYGYVLQGDYKNAEAAFTQFLKAYNGSALAPNAHYWVGESLFQQANYRKAIEVFLDAYSTYPDAKKAPDMLLKTGMSLRQIGEREAACATYEELLDKFPNASAGVSRNVQQEIKSNQC